MKTMARLFTRVAMCEPLYYDVMYKINPWMGGVVDRKLAYEQWTNLKNAVESCGVEVKVVKQVEGLPDMVFICDSGLVYKNKVYLSRFHYPERQLERKYAEEFFKKEGYEIFSDDECSFEGCGSSTFVSPDILYAGYGWRSQKEVYPYVQKMGDFKIKLFRGTDPRFFHLDLSFCPLNPHLAMWYPAAFTNEDQQLLKNEIELIEVSEADAVKFACNCFVIDKNVIMPKSDNEVKKVLISRGFNVIEIDLSEFLKAGGGAHCLILKL